MNAENNDEKFDFTGTDAVIVIFCISVISIIYVIWIDPKESLHLILINTSTLIPLSTVVGSVFVVIKDVIMLNYARIIREKTRAEKAEIRVLKDEIRAEGVVEGIAKEREVWLSWNKRREAAKRNNQPFDEPPPSSESPS